MPQRLKDTKAHKAFFLFTFCFLLALNCSFSQEVVKSNVMDNIGGKNYYIHTVAKGESVWKIAKAYGVTSEDIISCNTDATDDIKPGQKLKIPVKTKETVKSSAVLNHTVEKGESLYTLAKKYDTSIEAIKNENPGIQEKIKVGQVLKVVPGAGYSGNNNIETTGAIGDSSSYNCDKPKLLESYNIALMIPFYLDNIYQINPDDPDIKEKDASDYVSLTFLPYYEGLLMALDS